MDIDEVDPYMLPRVPEPSLLERLGLRLWSPVPDDVLREKRLSDQKAKLFPGSLYGGDLYRD